MAKSNIIRVSDVEIMALSDGTLEFDLCNFFPTIPEAEWQPHAEKLVRLAAEHAIVLVAPGRDGCVARPAPAGLVARSRGRQTRLPRVVLPAPEAPMMATV
jgi:hypothetical protein